jgi:FtsP/CotA-like multicopper oxidase with cupredoxin domain
MLTRREVLKSGALGGSSALLLTKALQIPRAFAGDDGPPPTPFNIAPFQQELPLPSVLQPRALTPAPGTPDASLGSSAVYHGIAPEFDPATVNPTTYELFIEQRDDAEIIPGIQTPVFTYRDANLAAGAGTSPGPTILARFDRPIVVRQHNALEASNTFVDHDIELSTHLHGGHNPAHSDGYPNFYILPGAARDYYYPNVVPKRVIDGTLDFDRTAIPSTMWYHDHGMDITGFTVSHGLAAFYLLVDDLEEGLTDGPNPVLPEIGGPFDIPLALTDQRFDADGSGRLFYDFFDHNGRIGDVFTVNGAVQPKFTVQRRKYRFRILNASNARVYQLRLSTKQSFLHIGNDSWLLPEAHAVDDPEQGFRLAMAERADLIIDFTGAPKEVYLENIMYQPDGRGPKKVDPDKERTGLIKFVVEGPDIANDVTVQAGTPLRPHDPIREEDIRVTRRFVFKRGNGAWQTNGRFFNPRRMDSVPVLDPDGQGAERWILENPSGGWWHPIHMHLEHHEIQKLNGRTPEYIRRFKSDVSTLSDNGVAEVFIRFRSYTGPYVFHCHNLEHEDMRMMATFDPRPDGVSPYNGADPIPAEVSGVLDSCEDLERRLFFEAKGDVDRLEGRGVGVPCDDFEAGGD